MYTNEPEKFLSATNGMGALPSVGFFTATLIGVGAFLIGGKYASGKWAWQKGRKRSARRKRK